MKIFISGSSRSHSDQKPNTLPKEVKERLDLYMLNNVAILVGDCSGVDRLVQEYLHSAKYRNVTVYVSGGDKHTRNNAGHWGEKHVNTGRKVGYGFFREKDFAMAEDADEGLAVWDKKSRGTYLNMLMLAALGKTCALYLPDEGRWLDIRTIEDLRPYIGQPGELGQNEMMNTLEICGFSEEMKEYLINGEKLSPWNMLDMICQAPVNLGSKLHTIMWFMKERNLNYEMFESVRRDISEGKDYKMIKKNVCRLTDFPTKGLFWSDLFEAYREMAEAYDAFSKDFDPDDQVLYLFEEWYDPDLLSEKSSPVGIFYSLAQVFEYIENEEREWEDPIDVWWRVELWESDDSDNAEHRYNYYIYDKKICWFEKMKPVIQENGNKYYLIENRRYLSGRVDLNLMTPFRTGDIVAVDCRPFGPAFHALVMEADHQNDCCFPGILFRIPFTDKWRLTPLKHRRFYKDAEVDFYQPRLSPLFRIHSIREEELGIEKDILLNAKNALDGSEEDAALFWDSWHVSEPFDKTEEQLLDLLDKMNEKS